MFTPSLEPGDIVDIIAPASKCTPKELRDGIRFIKSLGLRPRVPADLFGPSVLFSNKDEIRWRHLKQALTARDSKMIWCVRGGYGSLRLVPHLLKMKRPSQRKIFLGYSDITTLHAFLNQHWGWATIHGPMVERAGRRAMARDEERQLLGMLFGRRDHIEFSQLKPMNGAAKRSRLLRAPIVGGNMAVLQSALGTKASLNPRGRILFFEDIGERPHRVDRMLSQFAQAGWFDKAKAVMFGRFQLADRKDRRDLWNDVLPRFARECRLPVLSGLPVGHDPKRQMPLPFLTSAELQLGSRPTLVVHSGIAPR